MSLVPVVRAAARRLPSADQAKSRVLMSFSVKCVNAHGAGAIDRLNPEASR
jgi:hypothetical protein